MLENEIIALLRLQNIPRIGSVSAKKLIAYCGSPAAVFSGKLKEQIPSETLGTTLLDELHHRKYLEAAEEEWLYIQRQEIAVYSYLDPDYPFFLKQCADGPLLLFARGKIDFNNSRIISVVGTRNCTNRGREFCKRLVEAILPYNPIIVSGMAYGIDISIQTAAMESGLQTIGCLAHGLDAMYPRAHRDAALKIEQHGGMLTEFWSGTIPERVNFLKRNRIIAGLSQATVVVESAAKGGSLVTADIAMSYDREVFAVPGRPGDPVSEGCNNLIKSQKAQLITSAEDIITMLNWDLEGAKAKPVQPELFVSLDQDEQEIFSYLERAGKRELDQISAACRLPVFKTTSTLLNLEMKGVIRTLPGKKFEVLV